MFVHLKHGVPTLKRILQRLPEADRLLLSKPIYAGEWYSLALLSNLDHQISEELQAAYPDVFEKLGEFSAEMNLAGSIEPIAKKDVRMFLDLTAVMSRNYQNFGTASLKSETISGDFHEALVTIEYPIPPPAHYCRSGIGYFRRAVELYGGKNVHVEISTCSQDGNAACGFRIQWIAGTQVTMT